MFDLPIPMPGPAWDEPDHVLMYIVTGLVNGMGVELGVTLMMRGMVVSGTLISEEAYLDVITDMLTSQMNITEAPPELKKILTEAVDLRGLAEFDMDEYMDYYGEDNDDTDEEKADADDFDEVPPPSVVMYLHLKDPVIISPEPSLGFPMGQGPLMRLRMASIDGWTIGRTMVGDAGADNDADDEVLH